MKKILFAVFAAAALFAGCTKEDGDGAALSADFTISSNPCYAGDPVLFTAKVSGGQSPYTYEWAIQGTKYTDSNVTHIFKTNGTASVKLTVKDASGTVVQRTKVLVINPAQVAETGEITLNWVGVMDGYNTIAAPAVADDGSVYAVTDIEKLYKFNSSGEKVWEKVVLTDNAGDSRMNATPSIDTDGTIYVAGGSTSGLATVVAYNPDGTRKWTFTDFWNRGDAHKANITGGFVGIGDQNVYMGNTGLSGSVLAISKTDGKRKGHVMEGSYGPSGGARAGIVISKEGYLHWYAGYYGLWGALQSGVDNAGDNGYTYAWHLYGVDETMSETTSHSSIGCMNVNGKSCVFGVVTDLISTKVYAADSKTGDEVSCVRIDDTASQDQGGVVSTEEGYIVASLNYELGKANGGIIFIDPATSTVKARYSVQEKVSGSAAVDAAGNVHFFTESGYYYVVKPDYTSGQCELKVKREIATVIISDPRYSSHEKLSSILFAKFWCSAVIGDDGKIYCCFTDEFTREFGGVICLSYADCEGPSNSDWPMIGQNRRHTNRQK